MTRTAISRPLYQYLVTESRGLCNLCHRTTIDEIHHIVPVEDGGPNDYDNLIPVCGSCHAKVHKTMPGPKRLIAAKDKWVRECRHVIARVVSGVGSESKRTHDLLDSFDAVANVVEFDGFRDRLLQLLGRGALFENLFRVHDHRIVIDVDSKGSAKVTEMQRWSSFVPFRKRVFHIEGPGPCPTCEVAFNATAHSRNHALDLHVEASEDQPKYKSFFVVFADVVPADQPVVVTTEYRWPEAWSIPSDRYTYDVLGWAERVQYTMLFPADIRVRSVQDSYIDILGAEWQSIGKAEMQRPNCFQWLGSRLPLFSTVVINYTTERAV